MREVPHNDSLTAPRSTTRQDYMTPPEFLAAVQKRWRIGQFAVDLAASENNIGAAFIVTPEHDSLSADWTLFLNDLWLNPPFADIAPWAKKCAESTENSRFIRDRRIFFLVPAAVGSQWFERYVEPFARVYFLRDRICFDGRYVYPKDCVLAVYGEHPGHDFWRWRAT